MSVLLPTRPMNAVAAAAIALLVVGAGGAVGIGTSGSGASDKAGARTQTQSGPGQSGGNTPTANVGPAQGSTASTTTVPHQTATSVGAVPVAGDGPSSTTVASHPGGQAATTTTTAVVASTPTGPATSANEPATGTYHYATQGSASSPTQTYTMPPETTIVIAKSGCGETDTWHEGKNNTETLAGCPTTDGIRVLSETISNSGVTLSFTCDPDSFVPLSGPSGKVWKWSCRTSDGKETTAQTVTLDGPATATVGGASMSAEHVSVQSVLSGEFTGTSNVEEWFNSVGLRLKETGDSSAGVGTYTIKSHYTIQLESLTPSP